MSELGEREGGSPPFSMSELLSLSEVDRVAMITAASLAARIEHGKEDDDD